MTDIAAVTRNIQQRTHNDGFLWLNRNGHLKETIQDFKNLTPAERNEVASRLSDADLQELADDVNANGVGGANGLSADEIRWILRIEPTAFRQRLTRIRRALATQSPQLRAESLALAYVRDPARSADLPFGLVRRALKAAMRGGDGLGTHDPDGHLVLIDAGAHTSHLRGNVRTGITQEDIP